MVWAEKSWFIKKTIDDNYFNTDWFFWCDIGCFRNEKYVEKYLSFPKFKNIPDKSKIIFSKVAEFNSSDTNIDNNGIPTMYHNISDQTKLCRIQGGFFCLHKSMSNVLTELYENTFNLFMKQKMFAGKDQYIMYTMYLEQPAIFEMIEAKDYTNDIINDLWFSFLNRYSEVPKKTCLNDTDSNTLSKHIFDKNMNGIKTILQKINKCINVSNIGLFYTLQLLPNDEIKQILEQDTVFYYNKEKIVLNIQKDYTNNFLNGISKIVYINLDHRTDRNMEMLEQFEKLKIPKDKILRFSAIKHDNGSIGCTQSHIAVLEMAIREKWENVLILEDDFNFI